MINDVFNIYNNLTSLSEGFTVFLKEQILSDEKNVTIALSGGSTPKIVFDYWSKNYNQKISWNKILFFWGDERCVPPDDDMSNYGMTKDHLFDHIDISPDNIFRIHGENEASEEASWYSNILSEHVEKENQIPSFDLVILGLGEDGHTVSIFPYQINLWDSEEYCIVAQHPETGMERISITGQIVNNAKKVAFLVTGQDKAKRVRDIIRTRNEFINLYPAAKVNPVSQQIYWFVDEAAASLL